MFLLRLICDVHGHDIQTYANDVSCYAGSHSSNGSCEVSWNGSLIRWSYDEHGASVVKAKGGKLRALGLITSVYRLFPCFHPHNIYVSHAQANHAAPR